jgi:hypothetical protein
LLFLSLAAGCASASAVAAAASDAGAGNPITVAALPPLPPQCKWSPSAPALVVCAGSPGPAPGCENFDQLCCASQLPTTIPALTTFMAAANVTALDFKCAGDFGGGDRAWCALLSTLLARVPPALSSLRLDLSTNPLCGDGVVGVLDAVVRAAPGLTSLAFSAVLGNLTDAGAAALGATLATPRALAALAIDLSYNDRDDGDPRPLTAAGAGALGRAVGTLPSLPTLESLVVNMSYNIQLGGKGVGAFAAGLAPLGAAAHRLAYVELQLGFAMVVSNASDADDAMACLGTALGGLPPSLAALVMDLDSDVPDATGVLAMGSRLACLDVRAVQFPLFDAGTDCHCGILVDRERQCLRANDDYPELGPWCFNCTRVPACATGAASAVRL